jgi:hypothetical protein
LTDPIGFALDNFDLVGRYSKQVRGHDVDTRGQITEAGDADGSFANVAELGQKLAESSWVKQCVLRELFRFSAGREEVEADACALQDMRKRLESSGSLREALMSFVESSSFQYRPVSTSP